MSGELKRLSAALSRLFPSGDRAALRAVLATGSHLNGLCPLLLDGFPEAAVTLIAAGDQRPLAARRRLRVVAGGLVDLPDLAPGPYDLIVVRHPDIAASRAGWEMGLQACAAALSAGGRLLLTTDGLADAAFADDLLQSRGLALRPGSPYTAEPAALSGRDRYILLFEQPEVGKYVHREIESP